MIPVGPFEAHALIGVGGAGEVWSGVHVAQRVPVAIKVITAVRARDARYREGFANEVRAVAGLEHPGIVRVFDTGIVDAAAEERSFGRMVAGSPYLAMELAEEGSLRTTDAPGSWAELQGILDWMLETLGFAHAHGVIHRDLKPGNVLRFRDPAVDDDPTRASRLRLTDFGLAHPMDRAERAIKGTSGTPVFMAPEQFRGAWRDFGPWTDLYALGCLAYALATGVPPFRQRGITALMHAHLSSPIPKLEPRLPVPSEFEPWVRRLMQKEPEHRYVRASDAAFALRLLGKPIPTPTPVGRRSLGDSPTMHTMTRSWPDWVAAARADPERIPRPPLPPEENLSRRLHPPMPSRWGRRASKKGSMSLIGAGLGLYGLRAIPLVGRDAECDLLWSTLGAARQAGEVRVVSLVGPAGVGKSRLAEWFIQRADEVGAAVAVHATHSPGAGAGDGLGRMVAGALGCVGLGRSEIVRRVERWLKRRGVDDPWDAGALVELIWPAPDSHGPVLFGSSEERYSLIHRWLTWIGASDDDRRAGAAIVWLDDVQWGRDALGLAAWLQRRADAGPVVVVMTVREEALPDQPVEAKLLEEIHANPASARMQIGPLDGPHRAQLVQGLLRLEGEVARQVEERTGGNPLFAVQLVGDWVQRGVLEVGKTGFVLSRGVQLPLPDGIHQLWAQRLERVLESRPSAGRGVLEIASVLGQEVGDAEWRSACLVAGLVVPNDLVAALVARRLARVRDGGWTFEHAMLRESLERSARESGRIRGWHHAVAAALQIRWSVGREPGLAERLAKHLVDADRKEEADLPLSVAAVEHRAMSDYLGTIDLLDARESLLGDLDVPADDPRWGECTSMRAELLIGLGRLEDAEQVALALVDRARAFGWPTLVAPALRHAATVAAKRGRLEAAEERLRAAELAARDLDEVELARCLVFLCDVVRLQGRVEEALRYGRRGLARFEALGDPRGQGDALAALAGVSRSTGDSDRTEEYCRGAIPLYEQVGSRFGVAVARNTLAEVLRKRGDLVGAESAYRAAELLLRQLGSPEHLVPRLNLGLVLRERGDLHGSRLVLEEALSGMERGGRKGWAGLVHALLLPVVAALSDRAAWARHRAGALELLGASRIVDADVAESLELAVDLAESAGNLGGIDAIADLAHAQWSALGQHERASRVREGLSRNRLANPGDA